MRHEASAEEYATACVIDRLVVVLVRQPFHDPVIGRAVEDWYLPEVRQGLFKCLSVEVAAAVFVGRSHSAANGIEAHVSVKILLPDLVLEFVDDLANTHVRIDSEVCHV